MFRPCIDLHNGRVKQIVGGTLTDSEDGLIENFVSDQGAGYYANLFKKDGLKGGHIIMLGPGNEEAAFDALSAFPGGMQIGGGINPESANLYLEKGASHVIVTSYIFHKGQLDENRLAKMTEAAKKERLVLDLSCRRKEGSYYVVMDRWQRFTNFEINKKNLELLEDYCDEFLVHGVDVEGKRQGVETELLGILSENTKIPVTYAGGIHTYEDISLIQRVGKGRIHFTVGSSLDLFGGSLSYEEVIKRQIIS